MNDKERAISAYIVSHKTDTPNDALRIGKAFNDGAKWAIQATVDWLEWLERSGSARGGLTVKEMIEDYKRKMGYE